jgi:hypothetical protein
MATAPATPMRGRREMVEVKAAELFQFTKPGQVLEGYLRRIEPVVVKDKEAIEYLFENEDGIRCTCLGTADLNKKINPNHIGHWLLIRYESDQKLPNQQEGHSDMKIFKVMVSKEAA